MDVFGKLNDFLNNDESLNHDSIEVDDSLTNDSYIIKKPSEENEDDCDDSIEMEKSQSPRRSKRIRESNSQSSDDLIDLSDVDFNPGPSKSRRKIADEIPIQEEIDLSNIISPVSPNITKGKRGGRKPRQPRKISYKKALEILSKPILNVQPESSTTKSKSPRRQNYNYNTVDLTGDVVLSDYHNKNPLFQNSVEKTKGKNLKYEQRYNMDVLDDDIDLTNIFIKIHGNIRKYRIKTSQRFYDLFKMIAEDEEIPVCNVICFNGDKRIYPEDTPDAIDHRISSIYTCRLMDDSSSVKVSNKDLIEIKFQSDKWKKPIILKVSRFEPFSVHIKELCEQVNFKPEQFSLKFDGDDMEVSQSPIELDFEGGEVVDCRIKC